MFKQHFADEIKQLEEMVSDGLVVIDDEYLKVELKGRLLIRNVCMVFDQYLTQNVVKFSRVI